MEKEILEELLKSGKSLNQISKDSGKSLSSIRYWKDKHCLESNFKNFKEMDGIEYGENRFCPKCKKDVDINEFYQRKLNSSSYCKSCTNKQTKLRMNNLKLKMIEYKGGCCSKCGYDKYQGALEFHHLDPSEKDFNPSHLKKYKFDEKIKNELDKCVLVCANCHREIHNDIREGIIQ
jgi:hypothetical protein